jgi:signal transduction histidine kinase
MAKKRAARRPSDAEQLAAMCADARAELANAGRALHDDIGPLLAGAGLWLSTDGESPAVKEAMGALDRAMESVRALSQRLNPSPVDRLGLEKALLRLVADDARVHTFYEAAAGWPRAAASAVFAMTAAAVEAAIAAGAREVTVRATGTARLTVRVEDDGRASGRRRALAVPMLLAREAGLVTAITTKQSTIVSIIYAHRRTAGG